MINIDDRLIKEVSPKIGPNALSVLLAIAIHLNRKDGRCFPSHQRLMALTGMGKNAVYDALKVLKENGLLRSDQAIDSRKKQFGKRVFRLTTRFISIFVHAEDAEPLPENREPENREPENREPENREPENWETYLINESELINEFELINKGEGDFQFLNHPSPPVENPFSVEADFALGYTGPAAAQNGGPAVGPLPENPETEKPQTPASGPGMPPWGEYPKANTARELKDKLSAFYAKFDQEWRNTKEGTPAMKWRLDEIREVMWDFCEYAITADWNWTYKQFNGRLRRWFKEQPLHEKRRRGSATPAPVIAPAPVPGERFKYE